MIQFKRGKTSSWLLKNIKLKDGQPGYDRDRHKIKIGDGKSEWAALPYASGLSNEEILSSEDEAKHRRDAAVLLSPLLDSPAVITYGESDPNDATVGQLYLQTDTNTPAEVDYVIEAGKSGDWYYRKWKLGLAECWCARSLDSIAIGNSSNSLYYSNEVIQPYYPFTFAEPPVETATLSGSNNNLVWLCTQSINSTEQSAKYCLASNSASVTTYSGKLAISVKGFYVT